MALEHITTEYAVEYVKDELENIAATITALRLIFNHNHLLVGGIKSHYYCLPILKTETDRKALVGAAISVNIRFFLGADGAPYLHRSKEQVCGCAGCYTGYGTMAFYVEVFSCMDALDRLPDFATKFGADYYDLPYHDGEIVLEKTSQTFSETLPMGHDVVVPLLAGHEWAWRLA